MVLCTLSVIENTSKFLKSSSGKFTVDAAGEIRLVTKNGQQLCGFATVLEFIVQNSNSSYGLKTAEEIALLRQWLEYFKRVVNFADSQSNALAELNRVLLTKNFLIRNRTSVADVILYYVIYSAMASLSMQDKERMCNLSRWFATVQETEGLRNPNTHKLLIFSRNYLYS